MLKNPEWKKRVKPNLTQDEQNIRSFIKVFSVMLAVFLIVVAVTGIVFKKYLITVISLLSFWYVTNTMLKLSPALYNKIHRKKKIIPIGQKADKGHILEDIFKTATPYGQPVVGFYQNFVINVPAYLLKEEGYIVFFYIGNSDFFLKYKKLKNSRYTMKNPLKKQRLKLFQKDLIRLFNYIINMKRQPTPIELDYIFEDVIPYKKVEPPIHES